MIECNDCYSIGRLGWDVTPGRKKAEVTCKKCSGTGWHRSRVFKRDGKLTLKAIIFLVIKMWFGFSAANVVFNFFGEVALGCRTMITDVRNAITRLVK